MNLHNRINRLSTIITLLSKGHSLSTPEVSKKFDISKKITQTDFKEYLIPLFNNELIYYDYSSKTYKAKSNFLTKTLFSADELAVIAVLKNKSKDKYSDKDLSIKVDVLFDKFEDELSNRLYQKSSVEKIDNFKDEIIQIKNAIEARSIIQCTYNKKDRKVYPLKILNLEGYWYLIVFEPLDKKIKTFHLNTIKKIEVLNENYKFDNEIVKTFDNAITAYYKPENELITIELFIDSSVSRYFLRKPLNPTQRVIKKYDDGSLELEIIITDLMEIIPTIQRYIPYIGVITPDELKIKIKNNMETYFRRFE